MLHSSSINGHTWKLEPVCHSGVSLMAAAAPAPVSVPEPVAAPCFKYYIMPANADTQLFLTCQKDENDIQVISLSGNFSGVDKAVWGSDNVSITALALPGDGVDTNLISISCGCALGLQVPPRYLPPACAHKEDEMREHSSCSCLCVLCAYT